MPSSRPAPKAPKPTTVGFVLRTITLGQGISRLCCPDCHITLNLFQPDENDPSRMLGTCEVCSKWVYLVELEPDWTKSLVVELPSGAAIRKGLDLAKR